MTVCRQLAELKSIFKSKHCELDRHAISDSRPRRKQHEFWMLCADYETRSHRGARVKALQANALNTHLLAAQASHICIQCQAHCQSNHRGVST